MIHYTRWRIVYALTGGPLLVGVQRALRSFGLQVKCEAAPEGYAILEPDFSTRMMLAYPVWATAVLKPWLRLHLWACRRAA